MMIADHSGGIGNGSHTNLLIQSDVAAASTTFADTSKGGTDHSASIATEGSPTHSTAQKKFGRSSINLPLAADCLTLAPHIDWDMATVGYWTVDFWVRIDNASSGNRTLALAGGDQGLYRYNCQWCAWASYDVLTTVVYSSASHYHGTGTAPFLADVWNHVCFQQDTPGKKVRSYLNGVMQTNTWTTIGDLGAQVTGMRIGSSEPGSSYSMTGYVDEFRVTKGARLFHWEGFTPPNRMS